MKVSVNPYLHHHQNYLAISFQAKMKSKEELGTRILWEARAAPGQDRRRDWPGHRLVWRWHVREIRQGRQRMAHLKPFLFLTQEETALLSIVWGGLRYANGFSTQILLRPKYSSNLISVDGRRQAVKTLALAQDETRVHALTRHALNIMQSQRKGPNHRSPRKFLP